LGSARLFIDRDGQIRADLGAQTAADAAVGLGQLGRVIAGDAEGLGHGDALLGAGLGAKLAALAAGLVHPYLGHGKPPDFFVGFIILVIVLFSRKPKKHSNRIDFILQGINSNLVKKAGWYLTNPLGNILLFLFQYYHLLYCLFISRH
jgi:hypothetical protein